MIQHVIYLYKYGRAVAAVSINANTYREVTGIVALRRFSESLLENNEIQQLPYYIQTLPMKDVMHMRRQGFTTGLDIEDCGTLKLAFRRLGFEPQTKAFY